MNGTFVRNVHESFSLAHGQISKERDLHFNSVGEFEPVIAVSTICHVDSGPGELNTHSFEGPLLTIGVHSQSNADARSQRYQQQLIWVWSGVASAGIKRFVCLVTMRADRNFLAVSRPPTIDNHSSTHDSLR
jgi:hypothetical protein